MICDKPVTELQNYLKRSRFAGAGLVQLHASKNKDNKLASCVNEQNTRERGTRQSSARPSVSMKTPGAGTGFCSRKRMYPINREDCLLCTLFPRNYSDDTSLGLESRIAMTEPTAKQEKIREGKAPEEPGGERLANSGMEAADAGITRAAQETYTSGLDTDTGKTVAKELVNARARVASLKVPTDKTTIETIALNNGGEKAKPSIQDQAKADILAATSRKTVSGYEPKLFGNPIGFSNPDKHKVLGIFESLSPQDRKSLASDRDLMKDLQETFGKDSPTIWRLNGLVDGSPQALQRAEIYAAAMEIEEDYRQTLDKNLRTRQSGDSFERIRESTWNNPRIASRLESLHMTVGGLSAEELRQVFNHRFPGENKDLSRLAEASWLPPASIEALKVLLEGVDRRGDASDESSKLRTQRLAEIGLEHKNLRVFAMAFSLCDPKIGLEFMQRDGDKRIEESFHSSDWLKAKSYALRGMPDLASSIKDLSGGLASSTNQELITHSLKELSVYYSADYLRGKEISEDLKSGKREPKSLSAEEKFLEDSYKETSESLRKAGSAREHLLWEEILQGRENLFIANLLSSGQDSWLTRMAGSLSSASTVNRSQLFHSLDSMDEFSWGEAKANPHKFIKDTQKALSVLPLADGQEKLFMSKLSEKLKADDYEEASKAGRLTIAEFLRLNSGGKAENAESTASRIQRVLSMSEMEIGNLANDPKEKEKVLKDLQAASTSLEESRLHKIMLEKVIGDKQLSPAETALIEAWHKSSSGHMINRLEEVLKVHSIANQNGSASEQDTQNSFLKKAIELTLTNAGISKDRHAQFKKSLLDNGRFTLEQKKELIGDDKASWYEAIINSSLNEKARLMADSSANAQLKAWQKEIFGSSEETRVLKNALNQDGRLQLADLFELNKLGYVKESAGIAAILRNFSEKDLKQFNQDYLQKYGQLPTSAAMDNLKHSSFELRMAMSRLTPWQISTSSRNEIFKHESYVADGPAPWTDLYRRLSSTAAQERDHMGFNARSALANLHLLRMHETVTATKLLSLTLSHTDKETKEQLALQESASMEILANSFNLALQDGIQRKGERVKTATTTALILPLTFASGGLAYGVGLAATPLTYAAVNKKLQGESYSGKLGRDLADGGLIAALGLNRVRWMETALLLGKQAPTNFLPRLAVNLPAQGLGAVSMSTVYEGGLSYSGLESSSTFQERWKNSSYRALLGAVVAAPLRSFTTSVTANYLPRSSLFKNMSPEVIDAIGRLGPRFVSKESSLAARQTSLENDRKSKPEQYRPELSAHLGKIVRD